MLYGFEIIERDAAGRITKFSYNNKIIVLPNIALVIDPSKDLIPPKELKRIFKTDLIITNSYLIKKNNAIMSSIAGVGGLHNFFSFDDFIITDSGAYQAMFGGQVHAKNKDIIELQRILRPDIAVFLDVPSAELPLQGAKAAVKETLKRAKECKKMIKADELLSKILWAGPIQGSDHFGLLAQSARAMAKFDFDIYCIGSIVPKLLRYDYKTVADIIITAKMNLPLNKPIHAFGLGLPQALSMFVAIGCDIFDCAAYALFAYENRYMSLEGTHQLQELKEFPCSCPICSKNEPKDILALPDKERIRQLALHNLYITYAELKTIKTAIHENWLWELVQQRARSHPNLLIALKHVFKTYRKWLMGFEPISKKSALFWSGEETQYRPEVLRAIEWAKKIKTKNKVKLSVFGAVPKGLLSVYPFGQSIIPGKNEAQKTGYKLTDYKSAVLHTLCYQFDNKAPKKLGAFKIEISKSTGRIRRIYDNNFRSPVGNMLLGTIRSYDGLFIPSMEAAKRLGNSMKKVYIKDKEVAALVAQGSSLFAKFAEPKGFIYPGEQVAIYYKNRLIAVGEALLNSDEMRQFTRGVAVFVRDHL